MRKTQDVKSKWLDRLLAFKVVLTGVYENLSIWVAKEKTIFILKRYKFWEK